ncbi:MAG: hypothetical protein IPH16_20520 [Haliscomenobacter sp.]|nr:hypothetical protein [Haliscomenobacter sp.]
MRKQGLDQVKFSLSGRFRQSFCSIHGMLSAYVQGTGIAIFLLTVKFQTMKGVIQKPVRDNKGPGSTWAKREGRRKSWAWLFFSLAIGLGAWQKVNAQVQAPCSIICLADDPSIPVFLRLDDSCKVTINASSFIFSQGCPPIRL